MRKLSLDGLKVESYASQVSETELAEVKGGSYWACAFDVATLIIAAYAAYNSGSDSSSGGSGGTVLYEFEADSIIVTSPDGNTSKYYRVEGDSLVIMY